MRTDSKNGTVNIVGPDLSRPPPIYRPVLARFFCQEALSRPGMRPLAASWLFFTPKSGDTPQFPGGSTCCSTRPTRRAASSFRQLRTRDAAELHLVRAQRPDFLDRSQNLRSKY